MPSPSISRRRIRRNSIPSRSVSLFSSSESLPSRSNVVDRPLTCPERRVRSDRTRNFKAVAASVCCSRIRRNSIASKSVSLSLSSSRSSVVDVDQPPTRPVRSGGSDRTGNFKAVAASVA